MGLSRTQRRRRQRKKRIKTSKTNARTNEADNYGMIAPATMGSMFITTILTEQPRVFVSMVIPGRTRTRKSVVRMG